MKPSTAIVVATRPQDEMRDLIDSRWAKSTQRNYNVGWRRFQDWCREAGQSPLPAEPTTVAQFLLEQSKLHKHFSRIQASYGAIRWVHVRLGHPSPTNDDRVKLVMSAVKRKLGLRNEGKNPLHGDELVRTIRAIDRSTLTGKRDAALILVGFWLALRRDSLMHLRADASDLKLALHGYYSIFLDTSKTDQEKVGRWFQLERRPRSILCPVKALADWLKASGITKGAIFVKVMPNGGLWARGLEGHAVAIIIKKHAEAAGLDPKLFSGHSMRSGFVTQAMEDGATAEAVMDVTGHTSTQMLMRYWRHHGTPSKQSAAKKIRMPGEEQ